MSTRCLIAVINADGTGQYIYCHSDGYPEWNGRLLLTYYPTKEKALEIMALGDLSALGRSLASESEVNRLETADRLDYECAIRADRTSAKHRDRGECWKDSAPRHLSEGLLELDRMIKEPYPDGCRILLRIRGKLLDGLHSRLSCVESVVECADAKRLSESVTVSVGDPRSAVRDASAGT